MQYMLLPDKSSKLNTTGKFPMLLTIVMEAHTFSYSSLEALMMHTLVIGFTYLTAHTDPKVRILSKETFFHGHKYKCVVFDHTHIKMIFFKILNHYIINFIFIIKKKDFDVCVSKHYSLMFVPIVEFLIMKDEK